MTRARRALSEARAGWHEFFRRPAAVFFTFFFPAIIIVIFGVLIETGTATGGLFAEPPGYYVPAYLAVVVVLTPLSRVSSTVARFRRHRRFEKLASTPLTRLEWLVAHAVVNTMVVWMASVLIAALVVVMTSATIPASPLLVAYITAGGVAFCGLGALIGRVVDSQDGAIAASNAVGLPALLLSETFIPRSMLPAWLDPVVAASPVTHFSSGVRAVVAGTGDPLGPLGVLTVVAVVVFVASARALPWRAE